MAMAKCIRQWQEPAQGQAVKHRNVTSLLTRYVVVKATQRKRVARRVLRRRALEGVGNRLLVCVVEV